MSRSAAPSSPNTASPQDAPAGSPSQAGTDPDLNRYFTEQVVGRPTVVVMGPSAGQRHRSRSGVLVNWAKRRWRLTSLAAQTLRRPDTASVLVGEPLSLQGLGRARWGLLWGVGLLWTLLLLAACVSLPWWWPAAWQSLQHTLQTLLGPGR